jgi:hypothetical protein
MEKVATEDRMAVIASEQAIRGPTRNGWVC